MMKVRKVTPLGAAGVAQYYVELQPTRTAEYMTRDGLPAEALPILYGSRQQFLAIGLDPDEVLKDGITANALEAFMTGFKAQGFDPSANPETWQTYRSVRTTQLYDEKALATFIREKGRKPTKQEKAAFALFYDDERIAAFEAAQGRAATREERLSMTKTGGGATPVAVRAATAVEVQLAVRKSVSTLWALTSGPDRKAIEDILQQASRETLDHLLEVGHLIDEFRDGKHHRVLAKDLLAIGFQHTTSRLTQEHLGGVPDPQLHMHWLVGGAVGQDGKVKAIDSRELMVIQKEGGAYFQAAVARKLQDRFGLEFTADHEVAGISPTLIRQFSRRRAAIEAKIEEFRTKYGRDPFAAELDDITVKTRGSKSKLTRQEMHAQWAAIAERHGVDAPVIDRIVRGHAHNRQAAALGVALDPLAIQPVNRGALDRADMVNEVLDLRAGLTKSRSCVTPTQMREAIFRAAYGRMSPDGAKSVMADLVEAGLLVRRFDEQGHELWTTKEMLQLEERTLAMCRTQVDRGGWKVRPASKQWGIEVAEHALGERRHLLRDQVAALDLMLSDSGCVMVTGPAGTGKGVVIRAANAAWEAEGRTVFGLSTANVTAHRMTDSGVKNTMSIEAFCFRYGKPGEVEQTANGPKPPGKSLPRGAVVVIDEAGMIDSIAWERMQSIISRDGAKAVYVGDPSQLSAIGPSGLFSALSCKRVPHVALTQVMRQKAEWDAKAANKFRDGAASSALLDYKKRGLLDMVDDRREAQLLAVEYWDQDRRTPITKTDGEVLAPRIKDVAIVLDTSNYELDHVNKLCQERRQEASELSGPGLMLPNRPYSLYANDEIIFVDKAYRIPTDRLDDPGRRALREELRAFGRLHHRRARLDEFKAIEARVRERFPRPKATIDNGVRGTVLSVDNAKGTITVRTDEPKPRVVEVDLTTYQSIRLAYAIHVYKAQGATYRKTVQLPGSFTDKEKAYVMASRHEYGSRIIVSRTDVELASDPVSADLETIENTIAERMSTSHAKRAAISFDREEGRGDRGNAKGLTEREVQLKRRIEKATATLRDGAEPLDDAGRAARWRDLIANELTESERRRRDELLSEATSLEEAAGAAAGDKERREALEMEARGLEQAAEDRLFESGLKPAAIEGPALTPDRQRELREQIADAQEQLAAIALDRKRAGKPKTLRERIGEEGKRMARHVGLTPDDEWRQKEIALAREAVAVEAARRTQEKELTKEIAI